VCMRDVCGMGQDKAKKRKCCKPRALAVPRSNLLITYLYPLFIFSCECDSLSHLALAFPSFLSLFPFTLLPLALRALYHHISVMFNLTPRPGVTPCPIRG